MGTATSSPLPENQNLIVNDSPRICTLSSESVSQELDNNDGGIFQTNSILEMVWITKPKVGNML